jgi:hypothetical protein
LNPAEWYRFEELFDLVEGTTYYDVKELALGLVSEKNPESAQKMRENKETISDILLIGLLAKRARQTSVSSRVGEPPTPTGPENRYRPGTTVPGTDRPSRRDMT